MERERWWVENIAAVEAERDRLREYATRMDETVEANSQAYDELERRAEAAEARASRAEAMLEEAGEVLAPFRDLADWYHESEPDDFMIWSDWPAGYDLGVFMRASQLKNYRAAAFLAGRIEEATAPSHGVNAK